MLALVLVILAAAEVVARIVFPVPVTRPYSPHPLFGIVRTPNYRQMRYSLEEPRALFEFRSNALGFRGEAMQTVKKPAGAYRIFFVGGSTTENQHLPEEKTFAGIVQARLDARFQGKPRIEVANCGLFGSGVVRSLSLIAHRVLELEPDLIVLLDGENDLMVSLDENWDPTNGSEHVYPTTWKDLLCDSSRLLGTLDVKLSRKDVDSHRESFERRRQMARATPYFVPPGLDLLRGRPLFLAYLRRIALICEDAGVPLALMTQPTIWKSPQPENERKALWMSLIPSSNPASRTHIPPEKCAELMESYNEGIREVAADKHLLLVDLAKSVPKDLEHFTDDAHLSAPGNASVADSILDAVSKEGLPPRRHPSPY